jgi:OmpA-OmpF porin, OOP family
MAAPRSSLIGLLLAACAGASPQQAPAARASLRIAEPPAATSRQDARIAKPAEVGDADDDGVLDSDDFCPNEPEDGDQCDDEDGCPDRDNDDDGVADGADRCPNTAGAPQNAGCPLPPPPGKRIVVQDSDSLCSMIILQPIVFPQNDSALGADAQETIERVASTLKGCRRLLVIELRGQSFTNESRPGLAEQRAEAVHSALLARGVPERKLRVSIERLPPDPQSEPEVRFFVERYLTCAVTDP